MTTVAHSPPNFWTISDRADDNAHVDNYFAQ
jgi:hypothetical protein